MKSGWVGVTVVFLPKFRRELEHVIMERFEAAQVLLLKMRGGEYL